MGNKSTSLILDALSEVQSRLADAYSSAGQISSEHQLASVGLKDGHNIVRDYIEHGETGLAFEHLVYMVTEPSLVVSRSCFDSIEAAGRLLGYQPERWSDIQYET